MKTKNKQLFAVQADVCKALANAKRLEIIHLLAATERLSATELMGAMQMTKTNLSQHMRVLKQVGIVAGEREGTQVHYELASPKIGAACEILHDFLVERLERNGALAAGKKRIV